MAMRSRPIDRDAIEDFWDALETSGPPPTLPSEPLPALLALLRAASKAVEEGFAFEPDTSVLPRELDPEGEGRDDPYPGIAVGKVVEHWQTELAVGVAQLLPIGDDEGCWYVDMVGSPDGEHLVYQCQVPARGRREFASLSAFVRFLAASERQRKGKLGPRKFATHVKSLTSKLASAPGREVFDSIASSRLGDAWRAYPAGKWFKTSKAVEPPEIAARKPGWQRSVAAWAIYNFVSTRAVTLPEGVSIEELEGDALGLLRHLVALSSAMEARAVPELVWEVSERKGRLADLAHEWIKRWKATYQAPGASEASFEHALRTKLDGAIRELMGSDLADIDGKKAGPLMDELVAAAMTAGDPEALLRKLSQTLLDSEHVEEVFASDVRLRDVLRRALGG